MAGNQPESDRDFARQMFVDFDDELTFWRDHYQTCRFHRDGMEFRDFEPAIKLGINAFLRSHGRTFDELKEQLADSYHRTRGISPLEWAEASVAAAAAWERMATRLASRVSCHANRDLTPSQPNTVRPTRSVDKVRPVSPQS